MLFLFTEIQRDEESFFFEFVWMGVFIRIDAVSRVYGHWPWSSPCHNRGRIILFFKAIHCHVICNKPRFNRYYRISYPNLTLSWLPHLFIKKQKIRVEFAEKYRIVGRDERTQKLFANMPNENKHWSQEHCSLSRKKWYFSKSFSSSF